MKKAISLLVTGILLMLILFIPLDPSLVFTETRTATPQHYIIPIEQPKQFEIIFTHSIHLSDVEEHYSITSTMTLQLLRMIYEDLAVGMPGSAEENQEIEFTDGKWVLNSFDSYVDSFILYNSPIHKKLEVRYDNEIYDLKAELPTGKSYEVQAKKLSLIEVWRGEEVYGR